MNTIYCIRMFTASVVLAIMTTGCAPLISGTMNLAVTEAAAIDKTAKYFGVERKEITVTDFNKGALATGYRVLYQGRQYNCRIYYGEVDCKQPGA